MALGRISFLCSGILALALAGCAGFRDADPWRWELQNHIAHLGARNWIVVAESSFPAHSRKGVEQTVSSREIPATLDEVLRTLEMTERVAPRIFTTRELHYIENDQAPGIDEFRTALESALHGHSTTQLDYKALLLLLEDAEKTFDVLVIRTPTTLPYTSIFIELRPGYWDADAETQLRRRIRAAKPNPLTPP
jgi:hypothetical protein